MEMTLLPKVTSVKPMQESNALLPMVVMLLPIVTAVTS